ncbi:hypothetical protein A3D84_04615 [Candidatus Woesebacteria bacterium RIFCSPHIGHO2_02_FULL_42_20]|uniref:Uncharacterized protein n=1 Tax=Candidatus Woesebacteria bacterium RIFCSPHIGHO2_12_FULL_41_24 TaxID=1802510 RepID=A0A1F8AR17_9BACT|nr:MAG: hypothetical protein A2W15_06275 [Candidatus Woesebacteria bacterium RBG_16_41_13]OGM28677.1 MAG: hypothetical protein A2873_05685 [Candidatus Woesebacteria bacterium RIFCSPHIGHO2_01_FULL_42_80]OGM34463.1 MAG: hypothetical protein A3D84_04615 [Candidatus Woesebacteria bacterium RIFCSPHIGHO2_02_FULL_42_20]OGM54101.1 MAG: hypothetical protein A3E44_02770 [Candidatus Woesebacteria bacterium RIFCSPHIGHO2_12_FULL_41_24]OGM68369.1 MAG: hypothetical protein A2969_01830 [Candidatus Woesebacteri
MVLFFLKFLRFSSFFLRRLSANLNFPFAALSAEAPYVPQGKGAASAAPNSLAISKMVNVFEQIRTYFKGSGG